METSALEQYKTAVKDYAFHGVDYLFHNEGDEHALVILTNIFCNAERMVRIAANKLCNKTVVNNKEYIDSLRSFLDKDKAELHILLTTRPSAEDLNEPDCLYRMLYEHPAYNEGRILIKDGEGKSFHNKEGKSIHLCMGDDRMYRIENDIKERKAVANFGDIQTTKMLNEAYDTVFDNVNVCLDLNKIYVI